MGLYLRPSTLGEAVGALADRRYDILAGGTDYYPAHVGRPLDDDILDITGIAELRGITESGGHWRFGAATTWTELIEAKLPPLFDGLKAAAGAVGGVQIQNAGTIAGNICNASAAADGVPVLLSLDAKVELASHEGASLVPLAEFVLGSRQTARQPDQLVTAILVPKPTGSAAGHFLKLGARRYMVISIAMVAAAIEVDAGRVVAARVAAGACSAVAQRLPELEAELLGATASSLAAAARRAHLMALRPIDDIRADAAYRQEAALILLRRLLDELAAKVTW